MSVSILITVASPTFINNNSIMLSYVYEGAIQALGRDNVSCLPMQFSVEHQRKNPSDIILVFGSCMSDLCSYSELRKICDKTGAILVFWLHDDPYEFDANYKILEIADFIFSNDKWASQFYLHPRSSHLPMAASEKYHFRNIEKNWLYDTFFCGVAFPNRIKFFDKVSKILTNYKTVIKGSGWPLSLSFADNDRIDNRALPDMINNSKLVFNLGRHLNLCNDRYQLIPSTPGPRTFEAAMAGCVQLYHVESLEIIEYYKPEEEILLFDSVSDIRDLIEAFIDKDDNIYRIAKNSQVRTLEEHTYKHRIETMISIIKD